MKWIKYIGILFISYISDIKIRTPKIYTFDVYQTEAGSHSESWENLETKSKFQISKTFSQLNSTVFKQLKLFYINLCQVNLNWVGIDYDICWKIFWLFENSASWTKFVYFVTYRMPQRKLGQKNLPHLQVPSLKSVSTRSEFDLTVGQRSSCQMLNWSQGTKKLTFIDRDIFR